MATDKPSPADSSPVTDQLKEILADSLEVIADTKLDEGILKDLPVAGSFLKLYKAYNSFKDQLFFRKLNRFITELATIPVEDRTRFWAEYEGKQEEQQKLGEQLLIYLDRHDTVDKAALLARAFGAYLNGHVEKNDFLNLAIFIDQLRLHDLKSILQVLVRAGSRNGFYQEIQRFRIDSWLIPELESQRILEYEDQIKTIQDYYEGDKVKAVRQHRETRIAEQFRLYIVPELAYEVTVNLGAYDWELERLHKERLARRQES